MVEEIQARERRMMHAERMAVVGQLAAGVAHEINNPIGIIRGYLKTMSPTSEAHTLQEEIRILDDEAAACQRIAEDLLAYATGSQVRTELTKMREFLNEAVRRFDDAHGANGCRFVVNAQPASVSVDPGRIRQVVFNLLRNAVRATPTGDPIEVVGTSLADGAYEITVTDRGQGVRMEDRTAIFEPFFSKSVGGSGLGLAVCDSIVRAHGGSIRVEDGPYGGALFRVHLPSSSKSGKHAPELETPQLAPL
jgi:signal transduction histidine kinase